MARRLSALLLVLVFGLCIYRAKTQSFTVDEAFVFHRFVNKDVSTMAQEYDAANHVLHTLLTKLFRSLFGISELELRLSSLLGCLLYLTAAYRLSLLCFGYRWSQLLAVALLTLNPLVLDFMVASRGYGLALGLFLWSLYCTLAYWTGGREARWLGRAGVLGGLAIAANLTLIVPVASVGVVMLAMAWRERSVWSVADKYGGPAVVTAFVILVFPLLQSAGTHFYYGAATVAAARRHLLMYSLTYAPGRWVTRLVEAIFPLLDRVVVPLLFVALAVGAGVAMQRFLRDAGPLPYRLAPFLLSAGTLVVAGCVLWVARRLGVPYPLGRTGLYFLPLFTFAILYAGRVFPRVWRSGIVAALLLVGVYISQIDTRSFVEWRWDSATSNVLRRIHADYIRTWRSPEPPVVAAPPVLESSIEYYRLRRKMHWMGPLVIRDLESKHADYYLLLPLEAPLVKRLGLKVLHHDESANLIVAKRGG